MALFTKVLFALLLCPTLCLSVYATSETEIEKKESNELFKLNTEIKPVQKAAGEGGDLSNGITLKEIKLPAFFAAAKGGVIVAVAEAKYTENGDTGEVQGKVDVVAKYIEVDQKKDWGNDVIEKTTDWKTQLASENKKVDFSTIMASVVSADGNKIYIFLVDITDKDNNEWDFKLVKGTINNQEGGDKLVTWSANGLNGSEAVEKIKESLTDKKLDLTEVVGSAFVIKDKKIVFMVKGKSASQSEYVATFFLLEETGKKLESLCNEKFTDSHLFFFQWGKEIYKIPINDPNDGSKKVMVFNASGKTFAQSSDPITRLHHFLKDKKYFTPAFINERNVLLFTHPIPVKSSNKNAVYLWMSDGTRVSNAGIIVDGIDNDNTFYGSLLHTNKELFALYNTYKTSGSDPQGEKNKFTLARLTVQLNNITDTLTAWKQNENKITELCGDTTTTRIPCFTDGVVGFLCDEEENTNNWKDKYLNVNAVVTGKDEGTATKVTNGFTFSGKGAGAKWPVGEQGDKPYNFTDPGFTLVATVTIGNNANENENSVLGIGIEGNGGSGKKSIGLWCSNGKWSFGEKTASTKKTTEGKCNKTTTYQVALSLQTQTLSVYIDGKKMETLSQNIITVKQKDEEKITHFYFGVDNDEAQKSQATNAAKSYVSVTNVLLYNRPLNGTEINDLKKYVKPVEAIKPPPQNVDTNTGNGSSDQQPPTPPPTSDEEKDEKAPSPSRTEDGGVGGGGVRVFSLLLAVLCVSAQLLHL